jgi:uncharacterized protein (TIGR02145 family)
MKYLLKIAVISTAMALLMLSCSDNNSNSDIESSNCEDATISYATVTIGNQTWMQKNLNFCTYRNGDPIPEVTDLTEWANLTIGAWCYYENDTANDPVYGKLYNWYAVNDIRGLAPEGWHVPSDSESTVLIDYLGGLNIAGGKMKEEGTAYWENPNTAADNSSGFTGLPGGARSSTGEFTSIGKGGAFWSSTDNISVSYTIQLYFIIRVKLI